MAFGTPTARAGRGVHTQTIEGFFGLVKNGIRGVYHSVSAYLKSMRGATTTVTGVAVFRLLLARASSSL